MKILIACEESQEVCKAFRERGHEAYSCDLQECSGGHPEWHIQDDIRNVLRHDFTECEWDMVIAFPPCTDLAVSGSRWFKGKRESGEQERSIMFFEFFTMLKTPKVVIENPVGIMSSVYRKPDQIIQPWHFGHRETKATCLWLKGVELLWPTNIVGPPPKGTTREEKMAIAKEWNKVHRCPPGIDRAKLRSKTYPGIAKAFAEQWG